MAVSAVAGPSASSQGICDSGSNSKAQNRAQSKHNIIRAQAHTIVFCDFATIDEDPLPGRISMAVRPMAPDITAKHWHTRRAALLTKAVIKACLRIAMTKPAANNPEAGIRATCQACRHSGQCPFGSVDFESCMQKWPAAAKDSAGFRLLGYNDGSAGVTSPSVKNHNTDVSEKPVPTIFRKSSATSNASCLRRSSNISSSVFSFAVAFSLPAAAPCLFFFFMTCEAFQGQQCLSPM
mmetsp:Transcript_60369/g.112018  ORF Transcript_60369/g.112018 Transcript_60369/m.112018 type:complete len:237 (-) Transcript_60369:17-727(-)